MSAAALGERGHRLLCALDARLPPASAWFLAVRVWLAMLLALAVSFWLELPSASSAAVCVGILAQPKRGQALSKSFYRIGGTLVGFVVSVFLAAAFGQDRVLTLVGFGFWLGLCVFVGNYVQGFRAYGAMLSGYTVAIVAIANIDAPGSVFSAGIERTAAIVIGVLSITLINDALGAPPAYPEVRRAVGQARSAVLAYVRDAVRDRTVPGLERTGTLVRQVNDARSDVASVSGEFIDGPARVSGGRGAIAASFAQVAAARAFARVARDEEPALTGRLSERIDAGLRGDGTALPELEAAAEAAVATPGATPERVLLHRRAADILRQQRWAEIGEGALAGRNPPGRAVSLPVHRDFPDALRNAARVLVSFGLGALVFVLSGWPASSAGLLQLSATAALGAITPNPLAFARSILIAMPVVVVTAALARFLLLSLDQSFLVLALGMAPVVIVGVLLSLRPSTGSIGFIMVVFFPVLLGPANPQTFDPSSFIDSAVLFTTAGLLLYLSLRLVLPTSVDRRRLWSLQSARADVLVALRGEPQEALERVNLDSDRIAQYVARRRRRPNGALDRAGLRHALALAELDTAAAGSQSALNDLADTPGFGPAVEGARRALSRLDGNAIRSAATDLLDAAASGPAETRAAASRAVADLAAVFRLVGRERRVLRRFGLVDLPA